MQKTDPSDEAHPYPDLIFPDPNDPDQILFRDYRYPGQVFRYSGYLTGESTEWRPSDGRGPGDASGSEDEPGWQVEMREAYLRELEDRAARQKERMSELTKMMGLSREEDGEGEREVRGETREKGAQKKGAQAEDQTFGLEPEHGDTQLDETPKADTREASDSDGAGLAILVSPTRSARLYRETPWLAPTITPDGGGFSPSQRQQPSPDASPVEAMPAGCRRHRCLYHTSPCHDPLTARTSDASSLPPPAPPLPDPESTLCWLLVLLLLFPRLLVPAAVRTAARARAAGSEHNQRLWTWLRGLLRAIMLLWLPYAVCAWLAERSGSAARAAGWDDEAPRVWYCGCSSWPVFAPLPELGWCERRA